MTSGARGAPDAVARPLFQTDTLSPVSTEESIIMIEIKGLVIAET